MRNYAPVPQRWQLPGVGASPDGLGRYRLAQKDHDMPLTGDPSAGGGADSLPADMWPGQHNPRYGVYAATRGRHVAGLGQVVQSNASSADGSGVHYATLRDAGARQGMKDYPSELDRLAKLEDVEGNGVFDPVGSHGNLHPNDGIFQDHANLPGYLARERFFAPSEVLDITTGRPVVYVPGTSFTLDPRTPENLAELQLYTPGWPTTGGERVGSQTTVDPSGDPWERPEPVMGLGRYRRRGAGQAADEKKEAAPAANMFVMAAVGGLAIGLFAALAFPKRSR